MNHHATWGTSHRVTVVVRGSNDVASAVAWTLFSAGEPTLLSGLGRERFVYSPVMCKILLLACLDTNLYFYNIGNMKSKDAIRSLAALAQESRLNIFRLLVEQGPEGLPAGAIGEKLGLPNPTLSFHLKELSNAGLLTSRQEGRFIIYSADFSTMNELLAFLTENCCQGKGACLPACNPARTVKTSKRRITA